MKYITEEEYKVNKNKIYIELINELIFTLELIEELLCKHKKEKPKLNELLKNRRSNFNAKMLGNIIDSVNIIESNEKVTYEDKDTLSDMKKKRIPLL